MCTYMHREREKKRKRKKEMEEDLTNKRPIYVKQCIRNIIMEEIIMKQKEQQNNSSTDTKNNKNIILRVLGYVVNIIAYNKVQIDDGTAIMDAELLRVEKQKEDEDNNSDNNNKNNNKRHRNDNNNKNKNSNSIRKRPRFSNPSSSSSKFSKVVKSKDTYLVKETNTLPLLSQLIEMVGIYDKETKCFKCNSYCIVNDLNIESLRNFEIINSTNSLYNIDIKRNGNNIIQVSDNGELIIPSNMGYRNKTSVKQRNDNNREKLEATSGIDELLAGLSSNDFADMSQG